MPIANVECGRMKGFAARTGPSLVAIANAERGGCLGPEESETEARARSEDRWP